jgi:hypothetical protein
MRRRFVAATFGVALVAKGCALAMPEVHVTPSRASGATLAAKPPGCPLDFYRTKLPDRAYDEIATIHYRASNGATPEAAQAAIQARVCELGGDASVITRERYMGHGEGGTEVTATAVVYTGPAR